MMISCAPSLVASVSSPSRMAPNTTSWDTMLHSASMLVKQEPSDTMESINQNGTGFLSEGFHSASPASSKESHAHSPRSLDSRGEASPSFYDSIPAHTKVGVNLEHYKGLPYDLLTPPGRDNFSTSYSPRRAQPDVADATPPKSPADYCDSGYLNGTVRSADPKSEGGESRDDSNPEDGDFDDEPGFRAPTVNSHGKVKTFKCKQCEFFAVTKLGFWEHTKEHIKPEKMLNCPKCPFVTEYKHHLEYHMRNHFGSKPFQCNQCSYSCVNKSMLNSHLKSHSNIYQYRCADCNYATKYCHSLKLHLRKYQHNPDMVLNQDGTPNPLPIIDVYGTRRGPKQKSSKMEESVQSPNPASQAPAHSLFQNPFAPTLNFPYGQFLPHHFLFPQNNNYNESKFLPRLPENPLQEKNNQFNIEPTMPSHILQHRLLYGGGSMQTATNFETNHVSSTRSETPHSESPKEGPVSPVTPRRSVTPPVQTGVLDLTSSKQSEGGSPPPLGNSTPLTPSASMKNRRKGRAFKLQPAALRLQHYNSTEEDDVTNTASTPSISPIDEAKKLSHFTIDAVLPEEHKDKPIADASQESNKIVDLKNEANSSKRTRDSSNESEVKKFKSTFHCQYCDITFGDVIMYTMHMGYHGYNEPFTCNMCGESSPDKVSFFIHIARSPHS